MRTAKFVFYSNADLFFPSAIAYLQALLFVLQYDELRRASSANVDVIEHLRKEPL